MRATTQIIILGAGPYGLSLAAHLRAANVDFRIFGRPMATWREAMPQGMSLKSEGFASNLSDPDHALTLGRFCAAENRPYADDGIPVALDTFVGYGLAFQQRFVPDIEERTVVALNRTEAGFSATLDDGAVVTAPRIVVAVGISHFARLPEDLAGLPSSLVTHSAQNHDLSRFAGRRVTVLGAGSSALDIAGLLHEAGADVELVARTDKVIFQDKTDFAGRPLLQRLRSPNTGIGPGLRAFAYTHAPALFKMLPDETRARLAPAFLPPAAGWFMKDRVIGRVRLIEGADLRGALPFGDRLRLDLERRDGRRETLVTDHLIAATGYKVDLRRLGFLDTDLRAALRQVDSTPVLSTRFESSVPGLHFVGAASASSLGPMMRFVFGADYTARRLARHLAATASRESRPRAWSVSAPATAGDMVRP